MIFRVLLGLEIMFGQAGVCMYVDFLGGVMK